MDYKKKYKEALCWMRSVYPTMIGTVKEDAEHFFPELKESEDEKIRQFLIREVTETSDEIMSYRNMNKKDVLAWLEKQGEQKPIFEMKTPEESLGIDSDTYNKIVDECIYGEQKTAETEKGAKGNDREIPNSEQKPAWSEEDEKHYQGCLNLMRLSLDIKPYPYYNDFLWLKSLKDRIQPQQKWSEEDEEQLDRAIYMMEQLDMTNSWDDVYNWLKSLRPQKKQQEDEQPEYAEWSEEDEVMLRTAKDVIFESDDCSEGTTYKLIDWLKSIKERVQPKAKWSEEDSRILYNVKAYIGYAAGQRGVKDELFKEANEWLNSLPIGFIYNKNYNEDMVTLLVSELKQIANDNNVPEQYQMEINWLKSLRPSPNGSRVMSR